MKSEDESMTIEGAIMCTREVCDYRVVMKLSRIKTKSNESIVLKSLNNWCTRPAGNSVRQMSHHRPISDLADWFDHHHLVKIARIPSNYDIDLRHILNTRPNALAL